MRTRPHETERRGKITHTDEGHKQATEMRAWLPYAVFGEHIGDKSAHGDEAGDLPEGATPGYIVQTGPLIEEIYQHCDDADVSHIWRHPAQRALVMKRHDGPKSIRPHAYPTPHAPCANSIGDPRHTPCITIPLYNNASRRIANATPEAMRHIAKLRKNPSRPEDSWLYALTMASGAPANHSNPLTNMLPVTNDPWVIEDAIEAGSEICRAWYGNVGKGPARWITTHPKGPIGHATYDTRSANIEIDGSRIGNVSHRVWNARCGRQALIRRWLEMQRRQQREWNEVRTLRFVRIVCRAHHIIEANVEANDIWKRAHESDKTKIVSATEPTWPTNASSMHSHPLNGHSCPRKG